MTQPEPEETFRKFANRVETRFGRCEIVFENAAEIHSGHQVTFAFIEDEPGKIVGYFSTNPANRNLRDHVIYDMPRAIHELPPYVAAGVLSVLTGCNVKVLKSECTGAHGNN